MRLTALAVTLLSAFLISSAQTPQSFSVGEPEGVSPEETPEEVIEIEEIIVEEVENPDSVLSETDPMTQDKIFALEAAEKKYCKEWLDLSMQGKLDFEGLPVKPSVKIYMKRGESILMSFRAPIVGEAMRLEMCGDSLTIINKMSRKYFTQRLNLGAEGYHGVISDFQDILLGRIAFPGHGRMTRELAEASAWSYEDDAIMIYPDKELQYPFAEYAFVLDGRDYDMEYFLMMLMESRTSLSLMYTYGDGGWTLGIDVEAKNLAAGGSMKLSYPDFAPIPLQPLRLDKKYVRTDLPSVLKF